MNRRLFRTRHLRAHGARAALGLIMLWAVGEAFRELPLADAYAIFFAAPLLMALLSGPVMKEPAGPWRLGACAVGAFFDDQFNELLEVDGKEEAVLYVISVGQV